MRILIVNSSTLVMDRLADILSDGGNISRIYKAATYEEAKKLFKENIYDIVLIDIGLPVGESLQLLKQIEKREEKPQVIILFDHLDNHIQQLYRSLGADFFFDIYYDFEKISGVIDSICQLKRKNSGYSPIKIPHI
ncbi:MAG TPA: response regulator [Ferruginibacter sp.]|nr:response regulator [Ferruginibacter sp.]